MVAFWDLLRSTNIKKFYFALIVVIEREFGILENLPEMSNFLPRVTRLVATQSILFVCDIQELFRPLIFKSPTVIDRTSLVTKVSRTLDIPIVVTRQYPKVFGETCTEIQSEILKYGDKSMVTDVAKTQFSMMTSEVKLARSLPNATRSSCASKRMCV